MNDYSEFAWWAWLRKATLNTNWRKRETDLFFLLLLFSLMKRREKIVSSYRITHTNLFACKSNELCVFIVAVLSSLRYVFFCVRCLILSSSPSDSVRWLESTFPQWHCNRNCAWHRFNRKTYIAIVTIKRFFFIVSLELKRNRPIECSRPSSIDRPTNPLISFSLTLSLSVSLNSVRPVFESIQCIEKKYWMRLHCAIGNEVVTNSLAFITKNRWSWHSLYWLFKQMLIVFLFKFWNEKRQTKPKNAEDYKLFSFLSPLSFVVVIVVGVTILAENELTKHTL